MEENYPVLVEGCTESSSKKRPRKKYIYGQILQQMEFYFSDANLSRDRFLTQLLEKNKNVPLEIFLRFNKIRTLTNSIEEIAKALGTSELLKVTEDGKHVYRTRAVQRKENQEDCIIYVEQLPADANHDWVKGIFSSYGKVEYVSIPKFKTRPAIKGFAFVEFDTPEAAKQALEAFGSAGCCIPQQIPPEELCSVASFEPGDQEDINKKYENEVEEKQFRNYKKINIEGTEDTELTEDGNFGGEDVEIEEPKSKKLKTDIDQPQVGKKQKKKNKFDEGNVFKNAVTESEAVETVMNQKNNKRKLENQNIESLNDEDNDNDTAAGKKKKKKLQEKAVGEMTEGESLSKQKKKKSEKKHGNDESENDGDRIVEYTEDEGTSEEDTKLIDEEDEGVGADSEKSRKKKRAKRNKHKKKNVEKKENDPASLGLRILSKKEWRRLRNKYLNLQRSKMHDLKKHLARRKSGSNYQSPYPTKDNGSSELKKELKTESKKTQYIPGVIVHVDLGEPLEEVTSFKNSAKTEPGVAYVDANIGSSEAYIRCFSAEAAQKLLDQSQWENMEILEGDADKKYWKKILADRENKIHCAVVVPRVRRGRNKILKRAERELGKHIKFDD